MSQPTNQKYEESIPFGHYSSPLFTASATRGYTQISVPFGQAWALPGYASYWRRRLHQEIERGASIRDACQIVSRMFVDSLGRDRLVGVEKNPGPKGDAPGLKIERPQIREGKKHRRGLKGVRDDSKRRSQERPQVEKADHVPQVPAWSDDAWIIKTRRHPAEWRTSPPEGVKYDVWNSLYLFEKQMAESAFKSLLRLHNREQPGLSFLNLDGLYYLGFSNPLRLVIRQMLENHIRGGRENPDFHKLSAAYRYYNENRDKKWYDHTDEERARLVDVVDETIQDDWPYRMPPRRRNFVTEGPAKSGYLGPIVAVRRPFSNESGLPGFLKHEDLEVPFGLLPEEDAAKGLGLEDLIQEPAHGPVPSEERHDHAPEWPESLENVAGLPERPRQPSERYEELMAEKARLDRMEKVRERKNQAPVDVSERREQLEREIKETLVQLQPEPPRGIPAAPEYRPVLDQEVQLARSSLRHRIRMPDIREALTGKAGGKFSALSPGITYLCGWMDVRYECHYVSTDDARAWTANQNAKDNCKEGLVGRLMLPRDVGTTDDDEDMITIDNVFINLQLLVNLKAAAWSELDETARLMKLTFPGGDPYPKPVSMENISITTREFMFAVNCILGDSSGPARHFVNWIKPDESEFESSCNDCVVWIKPGLSITQRAQTLLPMDITSRFHFPITEINIHKAANKRLVDRLDQAKAKEAFARFWEAVRSEQLNDQEVFDGDMPDAQVMLAQELAGVHAEPVDDKVDFIGYAEDCIRRKELDSSAAEDWRRVAQELDHLLKTNFKELIVRLEFEIYHRTKIFIKCEFYEKKGTTLRFIVSPSTFVKVCFGAALRPIEERIYDLPLMKPHLVKHMTREEVGQAIKERISHSIDGNTFVELDYSAFESSQNSLSLDCEYAIYSRHCLQGGFRQKIINVVKLANMSGNVTMKNKDFHLRPHAMRWSGMPNTALGNAMMNVINLVYACGVDPIKNLFLVEGDDSMLNIPQALADQIVARSIFPTTYESGASPFDLSFCGHRYDRNGRPMVPNDDEMYARLLGYFSRQPLGPQKCYELLYMRFISYQLLYPDWPGFHGLAELAMRYFRQFPRLKFRISVTTLTQWRQDNWWWIENRLSLSYGDAFLPPPTQHCPLPEITDAVSRVYAEVPDKAWSLSELATMCTDAHVQSWTGSNPLAWAVDSSDLPLTLLSRYGWDRSRWSWFTRHFPDDGRSLQLGLFTTALILVPIAIILPFLTWWGLLVGWAAVAMVAVGLLIPYMVQPPLWHDGPSVFAQVHSQMARENAVRIRSWQKQSGGHVPGHESAFWTWTMSINPFERLADWIVTRFPPASQVVG